jgi:hypothetical protein
MPGTNRIGLGLVLSGALTLACTEFAPGSDELPSSSARGLTPETPGTRWSCLDDGGTRATPAVTPVAAGEVPRVVYSFQVVDLSTGQVYPGTQVRACGLADINCQNPVSGYVRSDARGYVDIPLFEDFFGFVEITSPDILPSLLYFTEPLKPQTSLEPFPYGVVSLASIEPLLQLVGVTALPNAGIFAARVFDCEGDTAPGASFSIQSAGVRYYFVGGLPSDDALATDEDGLGGFVNVPAGLAIIDALDPEGRSITGPQSVVIRNGWLSSFYARPPRSALAP